MRLACIKVRYRKSLRGKFLCRVPAEIADGEGQYAVFGGCDEVIHVVSLKDGTQASVIEGGSYIAASAAIMNGQVYIGNYDNIFLKADIKTGKILWEYTESDSPFFRLHLSERTGLL